MTGCVVPLYDATHVPYPACLLTKILPSSIFEISRRDCVFSHQGDGLRLRSAFNRPSLYEEGALERALYRIVVLLIFVLSWSSAGFVNTGQWTFGKAEAGDGRLPIASLDFHRRVFC